jgi:penicillin-binding protein 2
LKLYISSRTMRPEERVPRVDDAPADAPVIAMAILVENGGFGAQAAAPIARQVLDYYLLGKKPAAPAPADESAVEGDAE